MKILLLQPTLTVFEHVNAAYSLTPPLGLAYLAGYLRHHRPHHALKIVDCLIAESHVHPLGDRTQYGLSDQAIIDLLKAERPQVVGITSMYTAFCYDVHRIARLIKSVDPTILTVAGGSYATEYHALVMRNPHIDFVVLGEGEETFLHLIDTIEKGGDLASIPSLIFRKEATIQENPLRPRIHNLDNIPMPARDLLDMNAYLATTPPSEPRSLWITPSVAEGIGARAV